LFIILCHSSFSLVVYSEEFFGLDCGNVFPFLPEKSDIFISGKCTAIEDFSEMFLCTNNSNLVVTTCIDAACGDCINETYTLVGNVGCVNYPISNLSIQFTCSSSSFNIHFMLSFAFYVLFLFLWYLILWILIVNK